MKNKFVLSIFLIFQTSFAMDEQAVIEQMRQLMEKQQKIFDQMMDNNQFDDRVDKMFQKLRDKGAFENNLFQHRSSIPYVWEELGEKVVCRIEVNPEQDELDINIENGFINLSVKKTEKTHLKEKSQKLLLII